MQFRGIKHLHTGVQPLPLSPPDLFIFPNRLSPSQTQTVPDPALAPPFCFCLYDCDDSRDVLSVESYSACPSVTGLFHSA